jgi:hypothetical protein
MVLLMHVLVRLRWDVDQGLLRLVLVCLRLLLLLLLLHMLLLHMLLLMRMNSMLHMRRLLMLERARRRTAPRAVGQAHLDLFDLHGLGASRRCTSRGSTSGGSHARATRAVQGWKVQGVRLSNRRGRVVRDVIGRPVRALWQRVLAWLRLRDVDRGSVDRGRTARRARRRRGGCLYLSVSAFIEFELTGLCRPLRLVGSNPRLFALPKLPCAGFTAFCLNPPPYACAPPAYIAPRRTDDAAERVDVVDPRECGRE